MNNEKITALLNKHNNGKQFPTTKESFIDNVYRYIKATKQNRLICNIDTVSRSGMSRTMKFVEMNKNGYLLNYYDMLKVLGFNFKDDYMKISGCGMDMVFATHYNIINDFKRLGFITKKTCSVLEQKTPNKL